MSAGSKATVLVTVALGLGIFLTACGGDGSEETTSTAKSKQAAARLVALRRDGVLFAADSPWNTPVTGLPTEPRSAEMLELAQRRQAVIELPGEEGVATVERTVEKGFHINAERWAPLVVEAGGTNVVSTKMVCRQSECGGEPERVPPTLALPPETRPDPRFDGWLSVIDRRNNVAYDFWRARRQSDDTISYQYAKRWRLDGPGFSRPVSEDPRRAAGARSSGLPLFAGVIGPAELRRGEISHALAVSVPGLARRSYVQPASVTDGVGPVNSLPAGARIRLKDTALLSSREAGKARPAVEAILVALRNYGAIVVDRAASPTLYAAQGTPPTLLREDELDWLGLDDFEVVALPQVRKDPPLGQVQQYGLASSLPPRPAGGGG
ncbi:MAG TPA: hypothetical protein VI039_08475 [Solirubrobacterales bacterium]